MEVAVQHLMRSGLHEMSQDDAENMARTFGKIKEWVTWEQVPVTEPAAAGTEVDATACGSTDIAVTVTETINQLAKRVEPQQIDKRKLSDVVTTVETCAKAARHAERLIFSASNAFAHEAVKLEDAARMLRGILGEETSTGT